MRFRVSIVATVFCVGLSLLAVPAVADSGLERVQVPGGSSVDASWPAVVYNWTWEWNNYMVVWRDARNGDDEIWGRTVTPEGDPTGVEHLISDHSGSALKPSIDYNWDANGYLVVWFRYNPDDTVTVVGRRLKASGKPAGGLIEFGATDLTRASAHSPSVIATESGYLVAWIDDDHQLMLQRVKTSGKKAGEPRVIDDRAHGQISMAYNWIRGRVLLVWNENQYPKATPEAAAIRGHVLKHNGKPFNTAFDIMSDGAYNVFPTAAYNPDNNQFAVVYQSDLGSPVGMAQVWTGAAFDDVLWNVYVRRVNRKGLMVGTAKRVNRGKDMPYGFATPTISMCTYPEDPPGPPPDPNCSVERPYLVTWEDRRTPDGVDLYAQVLNPQGKPQEPDDFPIWLGDSDASHADVAANGTWAQWFIVWSEDGTVWSSRWG